LEILLGIARHPAAGLAACLIAGMSWIAVLASLNVSVQVSLPDWVRGRGLAIFVTVFFGAMTAGSALWGQLASTLGLPAAHFIAAAGALLGVALTWRWKLQSGAGVDLAPSMHWPSPILAIEADPDRGPVLVTVEYRIDFDKRDAFLAAVRDLGTQRRRDGAYAWDLPEGALRTTGAHDPTDGTAANRALCLGAPGGGEVRAAVHAGGLRSGGIYEAKTEESEKALLRAFVSLSVRGRTI
jgi:hypothetical protein